MPRESEMSKIRLLAVTALLGLVCSGCGTYWGDQAQSVYKGQANLKDDFFTLKDASTKKDENGRTVKDAQGHPEYTDGKDWDPATELPRQCRGAEDFRAPDNWGGIYDCTIAMKLLIDIRWAHFSDALHGSISYGSTLLDTVTLGLNSAGTLTPGGTTQILSAIAAGVSGFKTTVNEDILYKNSIHMILQQMEKDRALRATLILIKLKNKAYQTMLEAASDLYAYDRAGSWTDALVAMQSDTGNKLSECKAQLRQTELTAATNGTFSNELLNIGIDPCARPSQSGLEPEIVQDDGGTIHFAANDDKLGDASTNKGIDAAVAKFVEGKYTGFVITGKTDKSETDAPAVLAQRRAIAVEEKLMATFKTKKIPTAKYEIKGTGLADPASEKPEENRVATIILTKPK